MSRGISEYVRFILHFSHVVVIIQKFTFYVHQSLTHSKLGVLDIAKMLPQILQRMLPKSLINKIHLKNYSYDWLDDIMWWFFY